MNFWKDYFIPHDPIAESLKQAKGVMELQRDKRHNYGCLHCYNTYATKWDEMTSKQKSIILKVFNRYNIPWC